MKVLVTSEQAGPIPRGVLHHALTFLKGGCGMGVSLRRLGLSLNDVTAPALSPMSIMGDRRLNASLLALAFFTTFCSQMGPWWSTARSYTYALPSSVTAAKVVLEYGAHATSPTGVPRSNDITGTGWVVSHSFTLQSAGERNSKGDAIKRQE